MRYTLNLKIRKDAISEFESSLAPISKWGDLVKLNEASKGEMRFVIKYKGKYQLINPYETLTILDDFDHMHAEYFYIPTAKFNELNKIEENKKSKITTSLPRHNRKNILGMVALGGGISVLIHELTAISPDHAQMFDSILPMLVGPLGGLAHYYTSQKRLKNIIGRDLKPEEKKLLMQDAAAVTFQIVGGYIGYTAGVEAAKFVLASLNIFPQAVVGHICMAIGAGLGIALFNTVTQLLSEVALHGRIVSTPKQILGAFLSNFAVGMSMYALSMIPFAGFLKDSVSPAVLRFANMTIGLVGIALTTLLVTRGIAGVKLLKSKLSPPEEVKEIFAKDFPSEQEEEKVAKSPDHTAVRALAKSGGAVFSGSQQELNQDTQDEKELEVRGDPSFDAK